ncbi:MAG: 30S ribosomal protein S15 [Candidatus Harrisonbacteria bacterium CG10_big_fil_rev_8_21_14_0_10_45_28]|uniref:Small ribosomal subunit protein uS15 n=1 Tax=Candidatus Harrisonbacteria bacterium CG10_big_fil_rev_8_21_14_0_10_45_28 TaxID=1974586 RepID=A0A2H0UP68_9BACT|nr:MAG: 30S ribosomal protein S15 [Candidatus Harrisonbacteria bacterium CG10_big_fil_rev_8_21_14_0_10_45_28]
MLSVRQKKLAAKDFKKTDEDTGSAPVQVALLTRKIEELTKHLKRHNKDNHSRRGLLLMVGKRRRLLGYLEKNDKKRYSSVIRKLGLKK